MTDDQFNSEQQASPATAVETGKLAIAINIFTAPREAFTAIEQRPSKLFPLALVILSTVLVMFWYFSIIDFEWYVDDVLSNAGLEGKELEEARQNMLGMSQNNMMMFGMLGSGFSLLLAFLLQSAYLSLVSALSGDKYRFSHWFSLICWTALPYLLSVIGMIVTILLSPNGQLSAYDLDPLTLTNLGMQTDNSSLQTILSSLNLTIFWSLTLTVLAYRQWLDTGLVRAIAVVTAPYILIFGIWAYFVLT